MIQWFVKLGGWGGGWGWGVGGLIWPLYVENDVKPHQSISQSFSAPPNHPTPHTPTHPTHTPHTPHTPHTHPTHPHTPHTHPHPHNSPKRSRYGMSCDFTMTYILPFITETSHERHGITYHLPFKCSFNNSFGLTSKIHQSSMLLALCLGDPPVTGGFLSQRASNTENVSMPSRHHVQQSCCIECQCCDWLCLTHCGLVTPYGDRDPGQHWLR